MGPSLQDLRNIYPKTPVSSPLLHQPCRLKSTKGKKGKGAGGKPDIDDLIDALSDDEFEETEPEEFKEFKETPLSKLLKSSRKGSSGKGSKKDSGKQAPFFSRPALIKNLGPSRSKHTTKLTNPS